MMWMETQPMTAPQRKVDTNRKYQLQVTSTANSPGAPRNASMAWLVRPWSRESVPATIRLAVNPACAPAYPTIMPTTGCFLTPMYTMAARGGMTIMAVSDAMFPQVPRKAIRYGTTPGGTFFRDRLSMATSRPDSSQNPMAMVMVITRPRGANPVKFLTRLVKSHWTPALENRF